MEVPLMTQCGHTVLRRGHALTIGLVLAGVVAVLTLVGSSFFASDQKSTDVTTTQPSAESPTTGDTKTP
jgi:hypothetical protein